MILLSVTEFRANISKYLKMSTNETISLSSTRGIFNITPSTEIRINPSPSNDPYFDNPRNLESIERGDADIKAGRVEKYSLEDIKALLSI